MLGLRLGLVNGSGIAGARAFGLFTTTRNGLFSGTMNLSGGTVDIDWGDGNTTLGHSGGAISNTYADGSSKNITLTGDIENITLLTASTMSITNVDVSGLTGLVSTTLTGNLFSVADFTSNVVLTSITMKSIASLNDVTFPTHSVPVVLIEIQNTTCTELDFTTFGEFGGSINCSSNSSLTSVPFPTTTNVFSVLAFQNCGITSAAFDLSVVPNVTNYAFAGCSNITGVIYPTTSHEVRALTFSFCGITGNQDVSSMTNITGSIGFTGNGGVTGIDFGANVLIEQLLFENCSLTAIADLENNDKLNNVRLAGNNMSQAQVDTIIGQFWGNRNNYTDTTPVITLGGDNAAPGGTFQAACPPTTANEEVYELVNDSCGEGFQTWVISTS